MSVEDKSELKNNKEKNIGGLNESEFWNYIMKDILTPMLLEKFKYEINSEENLINNQSFLLLKSEIENKIKVFYSCNELEKEYLKKELIILIITAFTEIKGTANVHIAKENFNIFSHSLKESIKSLELIYDLENSIIEKVTRIVPTNLEVNSNR